MKNHCATKIEISTFRTVYRVRYLFCFFDIEKDIKFSIKLRSEKILCYQKQIFSKKKTLIFCFVACGF